MERKGKELLSKAIETPTLENVTAYAEHNKKMVEMSDKFSRIWQLAKMMPDRVRFVQATSVTEFRRTASRLYEMRSAAYLALPHGRRDRGASGSTAGIVET